MTSVELELQPDTIVDAWRSGRTLAGVPGNPAGDQFGFLSNWRRSETVQRFAVTEHLTCTCTTGVPGFDDADI